MGENFPNIEEERGIQVQEAYRQQTIRTRK
jgi:hypothetical protein